MISILILTRNEERDLPECLRSVAWSDDVHVFDSCSTDATVAIARAAGAHVTQRTFDNYASHRNAALETLPFRYPWIFILDADERPTPALVSEMMRIAGATGGRLAGYSVRRRDFLFGTWLKHAQISPFYLRLIRRGAGKYVRAVNEVLVVKGEVSRLEEPLDHFPFSKGIGHWIDKHNVYSTMEAELIHRQEGLNDPQWRKALFSRDFHERRLHQKALFYTLPGRPVVKWLYMVLVRGAVLDGRAGITYATLQAMYEYMIVLKTKQLRLGGA